MFTLPCVLIIAFYLSLGLPNYKSAVYANPGIEIDHKDDQNLSRSSTTYVQRVDTSYSPAPATGSVTHSSPSYVNVSQIQYNSTEPRYSPPPPPYSAIAQERDYQNLRDFSNDRRYSPNQSPNNSGYGSYVQSASQSPGDGSPSLHQQRPAPQSPYQERNEPETLIPTYTTPYHGKYPEGAPSRIVYTTQGPPAGKQYVQSRPTNPNVAPPPPRPQAVRQTATSPAQSMTSRPSPQSMPAGSPQQSIPFRYNQSPAKAAIAGSSPVPTSPTRLTETRPYQLKPTLDLYKNERSLNAPPIAGKEDEVDALTNLLMQNMDASAENDYFGR